MNKLKDLIRPENMQGLIQEQIKRQKQEENERLAQTVAQTIQAQVNVLREHRNRAKRAKLALKKMLKAVDDFDRTGDRSHLQREGLI